MIPSATDCATRVRLPQVVYDTSRGTFEAARAHLGEPPLANATTVEKAISIASEAARADLLISSATDCATFVWLPHVVHDLSRGTCEATRAHLGKSPLANAASTDTGVDPAAEAKTTKLAVASLAGAAAIEIWSRVQVKQHVPIFLNPRLQSPQRGLRKW